MKLKLHFCLLFIGILSKGFSQWVQNPAINTPVCVQPHRQEDSRIVSDSKGGAIIAWADYRVDSVTGDIYVQRMNAAGFPVWTLDGVVVCSDTATQNTEYIVSSDNSGAIIAWEDKRSGDKDIYAQKIDSSGNMLWTANGVAVCLKAANQRSVRVISDGAGGGIFVWEDSVGGTLDIYAQRISSAGAIMWTAGGEVICNAAGTQINPRIVPDGLGGAIIIWQDKRGFVENFIYSQRIDANGVVQWTANGVLVCNTPGNQTNPKLESDGMNGAYIGWQDKRNGDDYDIYAQRLSANGALQWNQYGITVCSAIANQSAIDISVDTNGIIVAWKDERAGIYQIYANRLRPDGTKISTTNGNGILLGNGINPNCVSDNFSGSVIVWQDSTTSSGTWDVFSQRLDSTGVKLWMPTGDSIAIATGGQSGPKNISTSDGGSIYTWTDKRNGNHDIYAHHHIPNESNIGIKEFFTDAYSISSFPNPFNTQTTIRINSSEIIKSWELNIYDISGKKIMTQQITNSNQTIIKRNNLSSGYYFYIATSKTEVLGKGNFIITE